MTFRGFGLLIVIVAGFSCLTFTNAASVADACQALTSAVQPVKDFFANTYTAQVTSVDEVALNQVCSIDAFDGTETTCGNEKVVIDFENYVHLQAYLCSEGGRGALGDLHKSECLRNGYHVGMRLAECARLHSEQANVEGQFCNALAAWFECTRARVADDCDEPFANITINMFLSFNVPLGPQPMRPCRDAL